MTDPERDRWGGGWGFSEGDRDRDGWGAGWDNGDGRGGALWRMGNGVGSPPPEVNDD